MDIQEIIENFALLDEWDDRYRYLIELGRALDALPERDRSESNKVQGCASQVWLATAVQPDGSGGPILRFNGEILATDAGATFERLGLREHLTPQRSNGFRSMVERIRSDARAALALGQEV
jgi:cysteine desulfuration protein SufE